MKLVVREPESGALIMFLGDWPQQATSVVADVELHRTVQRRSRVGAEMARARSLLEALHLLEFEHDVLVAARTLRPFELRTLDAIHVASALSLGPDLGVVVSYDARLLAAADEAGLVTAAPS